MAWLIQGVRVTSGKVIKADELVAAAFGEHGGDRRSVQAIVLNSRGERNQGDIVTLKRGNQAAYLKARLRRDAPEVAEALERGEIKSARAAAIEAGIPI
jgi:hypothetical protein